MAQQKFQSGLLDRKATLVQPRLPNDFEKQNETPVAEGIYCQKIEVSGNESEQNGRLTAFGRVDFQIRYRADVRPNMIWLCEGVRYDIKAVQESGRQERLILQCQRHD